MQQLKNWSILLILATSVNTVAQDAVKLNKDDKAPFTGILVTVEALDSLRKDVIERDGLKLINQSLNNTITLQEEIISRQNNQRVMLMDQNDKLAKSLQSERSMKSWERIGLVGLGILASGAAALAFNKAYK
jgi:hypothetical protein